MFRFMKSSFSARCQCASIVPQSRSQNEHFFRKFRLRVPFEILKVTILSVHCRASRTFLRFPTSQILGIGRNQLQGFARKAKDQGMSVQLSFRGPILTVPLAEHQQRLLAARRRLRELLSLWTRRRCEAALRRGNDLLAAQQGLPSPGRHQVHHAGAIFGEEEGGLGGFLRGIRLLKSLDDLRKGYVLCHCDVVENHLMNAQNDFIQ